MLLLDAQTLDMYQVKAPMWMRLMLEEGQTNTSKRARKSPVHSHMDHPFPEGLLLKCDAWLFRILHDLYLHTSKDWLTFVGLISRI